MRDSREGGLRSDRTGSPPERSPLRQSWHVRHTDKRAAEIDEGVTPPDATRSSAVLSTTALARNRGALMFSATWLRQGLLKGVQFLVFSNTKSVLPRPA